MRALVFGGHQGRVQDHPRPARGAGEALVAVRVAGVCDTDLQLLRGYMNFAGVPGHEFVGTVLDSDTPHWRGRRVVADINAGCGQCGDCREHDGHHCAERTVVGILGRGGALAEALVVPERCLVAVPDTVDDDRAVFAEPLAAALHVLDELPREGGEVVVVGDGKLGLLIALALQASDCDVTLVGHHRHKLAVAAARGVRVLLESEADELAPAATVVEATGVPAGLHRALRLTAPRGTLILKTTVAGGHPVDLAPIVINELRVVGSRCGDLKQAIALLNRGFLDPRPLISARFPLQRADEALRHAAQPGVLKVLVDVDG